MPRKIRKAPPIVIDLLEDSSDDERRTKVYYGVGEDDGDAVDDEDFDDLLTFPEQDDLYFQRNFFWPRFLRNPNFDHAHFIEVIKSALAHRDVRTAIARYIMRDSQLFCNGNRVSSEPHFSLDELAECVQRVRKSNKRAVLTWAFSHKIDKESNFNTHYTLLVVDPQSLTLTSIDSRGLDYAQSFCSEWRQERAIIQHMFNDYRWQDYCYFDIQAAYPYDHFCQTWSLFLLREFEQERDGPNRDSRKPYDFSSLIAFWRELIKLPKVVEAIYREIYCETHDVKTGERVYEHYFSTLEALVHRSNTQYYRHRASYLDSNYTFIEDFLHHLDSASLHKILGGSWYHK